ncbi:MAG: hypothetical protein RLZ12_992 [Bacillota bacterium]|jgi:cell division protein FtsI/penicillin-binding protein 2
MLGIGLLFCFMIVIARLIWIQTWEKEGSFTNFGHKGMVDTTLKPRRGTIYDCKRQILAVDREAFIIRVDPSRLKDKAAIVAAKLAPVLQISENDLYTQLTENSKSVELGKKSYSIEVKHKVQQIVTELELQGAIYTYPCIERFYPMAEQAAQIIGFLNKENKAVLGIEKEYNSVLTGTPGDDQYIQTKDGVKIRNGGSAAPPKAGNDLVLTLDIELQKLVANKLEKVVQNLEAKQASAAIIDADTGAIKAMANCPSFNLNNFAKTYSPEKAQNRVLIPVEVGSIFKPVILARSIEKGQFNSNETFSSGSITINDRTIHDWQRDWGEISYKRAIELSSNVGFVKLAQKLGEKEITQAMLEYGFGDLTNKYGNTIGIDLPGEGRGCYFGRQLNQLDLATLSFGQSFTIPPIQLLPFYSAIANGGYRVMPYLVQVVREAGSESVLRETTPVYRQILKPTTATTLQNLLQGVIKNKGTAQELQNINVKYYNEELLAKTATAQKPRAIGKGYETNKYICSIICCIPRKEHVNAQVLYISFDEPRVNGELAATNIATTVAKEILAELGENKFN